MTQISVCQEQLKKTYKSKCVIKELKKKWNTINSAFLKTPIYIYPQNEGGFFKFNRTFE